MEGDGSPLSSLCMVRAAELFPPVQPEKEDDSLQVMFIELPGEFARYLGRTDDGVLALSNYRICLKSQNGSETEISIPLGVIEYVSIRDLFHLIVSCKDASSFKCSFPTSEQCTEWQRRISLAIGVPPNLESLFAFSYYAWASEMPCPAVDNEWTVRMQRATNYDDDFRREVKRLDFNINTTWRISTLNIDFKLCPSYPRLLLVPQCITDDTLLIVASFRSSRRIPSVVWRHKTSGAVLARCSQPEVGWLGWRNPKDEQLLKAIADACAFDGAEHVRKMNNASAPSESSSTDGSHEEVCMDEVKKVLIVDARSYASAVTNRARGGGCECAEYYPCAQIEFMSLGNIHVIRKSFHGLRQLCASPADSQNWFTSLDRTMWLTHVASMLQSAMTVCHAIEREGRPVLVHCSDGWDRTPQLVATALLCLDPYYRTVEGFRILVEREWLSFGHKFADRIGHGPGSDETNERCPVFLQWLDCVHQIQKQFPCSFEFSMGYLIKLAQHVFSCMFGTFLCNTYKERIDNSVFDRTYSVWPFLSGSMYKNPLYVPNREQVLWPAYHLSNMAFWSEVYTSSFGNQNHTDKLTNATASSTAPTAVATSSALGTTIVTPSTNDVTNSEPRSPMIKTRSYGDLQLAGSHEHTAVMNNGLIRRSSDPNMMVDAHFGLNLSSEPSIETLPEFNGLTNSSLLFNNINDETIANFCSDTSRELNNLTEELQCSDLEIGKSSARRLNYNDHLPTDMYGGSSTVQRTANDAMYQPGSDTNSDIIESSPFYTQLKRSEHLVDDNLFNLSLNVGDTSTMADSQQPSERDNLDSVDGCIHGNRDSYMDDCMLQSVDLADSSLSSSPMNSAAALHNFWHGNVETSTDTLVPVIESHPNGGSIVISPSSIDDLPVLPKPNDLVNGSSALPPLLIHRNGDLKPRILPEVHHTSSKLRAAPSNTTANNINNGNSQTMNDNVVIQPEYQRMNINGAGNVNLNAFNATAAAAHSSSLYRRRRNSSNSRQSPMDLISPNGVSHRPANGSISPILSTRFSTPAVASLPPTPSGSRPLLSQIATPVAITCPDGLAPALSEQNLRLQQIVYEAKLREEALQKELHATRLALLQKTKCSTCNIAPAAPAEETEDVVNVEDDDDYGDDYDDDYDDDDNIQRSQSESPDSQIHENCRASSKSVASVVDNGLENVSICSWEAVEDRNNVTSATTSAHSNASSVLWVPDHAASRCSGCETEFWLGRRRHHCRSCGQIFCADCSEFWAPLPDERLYTSVRLCGPCYHRVTKIQMQQFNRNSTSNQQARNGQSTSSDQQPQNDRHYQHPHHSQIVDVDHGRHPLNTTGNGSSTTSAPTPSAASLEPCKQAMVTNANDRSPLKVTTATN